MTDNRRWVLRRRPVGAIAPGDLVLERAAVPQIGAGEVLVRNIYLSLAPTQRLWMSQRDQYMEPVQVGEVMRGGGMGVVEASRCDRFRPGDLVSLGFSGWETYSVAPESRVSKVRYPPDLPMTAALSVLGATGLTAYFGMVEVARPRAGDTVVVTAAAGAVGSIAGQIAKIMGARVIGICGSQQKGRWLTDELGFDGAIDYKTQDVGAELDRLCPEGVDVGFENVGGPIMDAVLARTNNFGRMAVCGQISTYNAPGAPLAPSPIDRVLMRRLRIEGFIIGDYFPRAREGLEALGGWIRDGRLRWKVHVVQGLENAVEAMDLLFTGQHDGKLLIQISPEPPASASS